MVISVKFLSRRRRRSALQTVALTMEDVEKIKSVNFRLSSVYEPRAILLSTVLTEVNAIVYTVASLYGVVSYINCIYS